MQKEIEMPYGFSRFVGRRTEQRDFILSLANCIRSYKTGEKINFPRLFLIYGEGGMGKTWLLNKLRTMCDEYKDFATVFIDWDNYQINSSLDMMKTLIEKLADLGFQKECKSVQESFRQYDLEKDKKDLSRLNATNNDKARERFDPIAGAGAKVALSMTIRFTHGDN